MSGRQSWSSRLRSVGREPDPRFTLANERTFLAWIRTALALIAGGIGVVSFVPEFAVPGAREVVAAVLVLFGVALSATAFHRWYRTELALRRDEPLPAPSLAPILGYGVAIVAVATLVLVLIPA
ncbi:DUF202 domain-containing protein [Carbonactinospora thermoautotrophica]|uniref:DUF202 domain-containing protein n=1 Tax=Carbonactinospora thermoautotrophica TaxID=1469144 RepID=A0A132MKF9_9ACTN|nr:DUF202 domain-containing protein [Carbonactinospora thermoautotrophica]KWW97881.1 hypothetical protein TH66_20980 [Carbonactinospora thermoautotrophica]KWX08740.1 hypothetical protein TR74_13595 [Carbonactinospora thermoautotrophica]MCX9191975.1 DUF202 domain-containing protein [Carbonactinospora thermoautotrophica]